MINSWHFFVNFLDVPTAVLRVTPQFSLKMKDFNIAQILGKFLWYIVSVVHKFSNFKCFLPAETVILGSSWVTLWLLMTWEMMHQIAYGFYWSIKKWPKLVQKSFWLILVCFFVYALPHLMSYTPRFCQMKDLINIYIYIYIYTNLPVDVIVSLPHPRSGDSQG